MKKTEINLIAEITTVYIPEKTFPDGEPVIAEMAIAFENGPIGTVQLPPNKIEVREIRKQEPRLPANTPETFADELRAQLSEGLASGRIRKGLYLKKSGCHQLPDGGLVYTFGPKLLGTCKYPYLLENDTGVVPRTLDVQPGAMERLGRSLLCAKPQALIAGAYTLVTHIRSWVRSTTPSWQAVLNIVGGQGLGKTYLARILTDWYQDEDGDCPLFLEAGGSMAAIRDEMNNARDLPLVVDDLCKSASRTTERERKELGAKLVREGANAAPIIKKRPGGHTEKLKCAAGVILTAEFALENASDITRCIFVPINSPLDLPKSLTSQTVGDAVAAFLNWFPANQAWMRDELKKQLTKEYPSELHQRVKNNFTILRFGFQAFLRAAMDEGMPEEISSHLMKHFDNAAVESIDFQQGLLRKLDAQNKKANLPYLIIDGFYNDGFDLAKKPDKLPKHEGVIWKRDLCLRPEALERFVRMQDGYQNYTLSKISQELKDIGALVLQEEGTAQVKLRKDLPRVYRLRLDVLRSEAEQF